LHTCPPCTQPLTSWLTSYL